MNATEGEIYKSLGKMDLLGPLQDCRKLLFTHAPSGLSEKKVVRVNLDMFFGPFAELALSKGDVTRGMLWILDGVPFELLLGDPPVAALYRILDGAGPTSKMLRVKDVRKTVTDHPRPVPAKALLQLLGEVPVNHSRRSRLTDFVRSLKTLATICLVYV